MTAHSTILVVDVSPLVRSCAAWMIHKAFPELEVVETDRFATALELVKTRHPLVVMTDIHLKEGSGLRLAELISAAYPDVVVVVFTNDDAPEYKAEALRRGADFFISKVEPDGTSLIDIIWSTVSKIEEA